MTQLEICNYALGKLGESTISAFNDTRPAAAVLRTHYQATLNNLVRKYRWNFARKSVVLEPAYVVMDTIARSGDPGSEALVTKSSHGLATGDRVLVKDTVEADGVWEVLRLDAGEFRLVDSAVTDAVELGSYHIMPIHTYGYKIALPNDCASLRTVDGYEAKNLPRNYVIEGDHIFCDQEEIDVVYTQRQVGGTDEGGFDDTFTEVFSTLLAANIAIGVTGAIARRNIMMKMYKREIMDALMSNVFERRDPNINRKYGDTSYEARTTEQ